MFCMLARKQTTCREFTHLSTRANFLWFVMQSTADRTLDQQCTVTRPGLAPIAAALPVELAVSLLHHPLGISAPADYATLFSDRTVEPLGILPHQVRSFLAHFSQLVVVDSATDKCTACSSTVVHDFQEKGMDFVLHVLNQPNYLEDLTGLTEMMAKTENLSLNWDDKDELSDEAEEILSGRVCRPICFLYRFLHRAFRGLWLWT